MSLPFSNVDNLTGDVVLREGYHTEIGLTLSEITKVLGSKETEIHFGNGKKFCILPDSDEPVYRVKVYKRDMTVRTSFSMNAAEWYCVVAHSSNITQPPVHNEICTFCSDLVYGVSEHYGCKTNMEKFAAFALTLIGEMLIDTTVNLTKDIYAELMEGQELGLGIDYQRLKRAYGFVKRQSVVELMNVNVTKLIENGPIDSPNENILHYDNHFTNFKACAYSHIYDIVNHDLGGDFQQELSSLDFPEDM